MFSIVLCALEIYPYLRTHKYGPNFAWGRTHSLVGPYLFSDIWLFVNKNMEIWKKCHNFVMTI